MVALVTADRVHPMSQNLLLAQGAGSAT